jgi:hypothetical protein
VVVHASGVSFYLDAVLFVEFEEVPLSTTPLSISVQATSLAASKSRTIAAPFADTTAPLGVGKTAPTAFFFMASG